MQRIPMLLLIMLFFSGLMFGQGYAIHVTADDQTTLDFTQISVKKNSSGVSGQKEFFSMDIEKPIANEEVRLYGELSWQDVDKSAPEFMASFLTAPFSMTHLTNQQFGNVIAIDDDKSDSKVVDRNISKGKLVGKYFLSFRLYRSIDPNRIPRLDPIIPLATSSASFEVKNPTQTLTIIDPVSGDNKNVTENISIAWTQVDGIDGYNGTNNKSYYWIRANKILPGETADGALSKNSLYVDKKLETPSGQTSANWQIIKNKDWSVGDNIVVVVAAVFPNGLNLFSSPVTFTVTGSSSSSNGGQTGGGNQQNSPYNIALLTALGSLPPGLAAFIPAQFLQGLSNGQLIINDISLDGTSYSLAQLQSLFQMLSANPSRIISLTLNPR